jgi:2'-5' RNA ligase
VRAVVSLLDQHHYQWVAQLRDELKQEFGVCGIYGTPFPHFSYQVAEGYDVDRLQAVLKPLASRRVTFQVRTAGLGLFPGPRPVLYIPVVRTDRLARFHQSIWKLTEGCGTGVLQHYHPDFWMPHITLGYGDLTPDNLGPIMRRLAERPLAWEITVDNLALIFDTDGQQGLEFRLNLRRR